MSGSRLRDVTARRVRGSLANMRRLALLSLVLAACRTTNPTGPEHVVALRLEGIVELKDPDGALGPADAQGNVSFFIYDTNEKGFCLRGAAPLVAVARNVLRERTIGELRDGVPFAFDIYEAADFTPPIDLYPVAVFQRTRSPDNICEIDPNDASGVARLFNARGTSAGEGAALSMCCGREPALERFGEAAMTLNRVFTLFPDTERTPDACPKPEDGFNRCALGAACAAELGSEASVLLTAADGSPCP